MFYFSILIHPAQNTLNPVNGFLQPEMLLDDDNTTTANVPSQHKKGNIVGIPQGSCVHCCTLEVWRPESGSK